MAGYTAEELARLSDVELDDVIEALVMGSKPVPSGLLPWLRESMAKRYAQVMGGGSEKPSYSSSLEGMGVIMEKLLGRGFTVAVAPGGVVWVAGAGREIKYVGGVAMPRAVAIASVLAVQGE